MRGTGGWWRRKSTPAKVETYTRWSYLVFPVIEVGAFGPPVLRGVGAPAGGWLFALLLAHAVLATVTALRALDWVRGRREQPVRLMCALAAVTGAPALLALAVADGHADAAGALGGMFGGVLAFGAGTIALGIRRRSRVLYLVAGFGAGAAALTSAFGAAWTDVLATSLAVLLGSGFFAFTSVFSVWLLNAVYELDEARETRTRLAVAEERLRFGRDLHDVLGRNLAVVALKSELAVQLARRGRPEAVEQMIEVQRIAQESQREVRDVVRGYREVDLGVELSGAHGVLTAAGIECEVRAPAGAADRLPAGVQSALGWVVREATTNVLRHGDAARCSVRLRVTEGHVVLTVENDGVEPVGGGAGSVGGGAGSVRGGAGPVGGGAGPVGGGAGPVGGGADSSGGTVGAAGGGRGGSGLAGLRERLAEVDGTLEAGVAGAGLFRVVAEVPLRQTAAVREVTA
ncbi:sensor histidine kinase [Streptomyces sp. NPDC088812]|uniref:sensor histidine kinase n=1 Tax=Streptomyces sp. NPDC088812 TaxID=3365905 RepID=UPI0038280B67